MDYGVKAGLQGAMLRLWGCLVTKGYQQIHEGEWIEPVKKGFVDQCCSCGLVHVIDFAVVDRKTKEAIPNASVQFKLRVDHRKTAASRRKFKFSKDD